MPAVPIKDESDPFSLFNSVPEVLAFGFKQYGSEWVEELLKGLIAPEQPNPASREDLEGFAAELEKLGFKPLAALILAAAKQAQPAAELGPHCPYVPSDGIHFVHWYRSQGRPVPKWARRAK